MSRAPEVSVVMGVHNPGPHLRETLESVLGQEDVDLELVVIDDGCTDESASLLAEFAATDCRMRILRQLHGGLTLALTYGCREARGRYIARQDAGDLSAPHRLMRQKAAFDQDRGVLFVSCWTEFCGPNLEFLHLTKGASVSPRHILNPDRPGGVLDGPTCHGSVMFSRDAYIRVGGYRTAFYYAQDWDLWYRLAEVGKFQCVQDCLYRVRVLPTGLSANKRLQIQYARLARLALEARQRGESDAAVLESSRGLASRLPETSPAGRAAVCYQIGASLARNGDPRAAGYLVTALRRNPLLLKGWPLLAWVGLRRLALAGMTTGRRRDRDAVPRPKKG